MEKNIAKQILSQSIIDLQRKNKNIQLANLEAEVINLTCLAILKKQKELKYRGTVFPYDFKEKAIKSFTEAAMDLFPSYTFRNAAINQFGINQNLNWDGMWGFLRDYFQKNHDIDINDIEKIESMFHNSVNQTLIQYPLDDFDAFTRFNEKWYRTLSRDEKNLIATESDNLNNKGVDAYEEGDILRAISFYEKALKIMPNNDDALKNLKICYSQIGQTVKSQEMAKKLRFLGY